MKRFPTQVLAEIDATKYLYIRAGASHRFIAIWVVVVEGRAIVRPWNDRSDGWYRAFLEVPRGAIRLGRRVVRVKARRVRSERVNDLVDGAYARKYTTRPNQQYVKGFATAARRAMSIELAPA